VASEIEKVISFLEDSSITAKLVFGNRITISETDPTDRRKKIKTRKMVLTYAGLSDDVVEEYRKDFLKQVELHKGDTRLKYNGSDFDPDGYQYYKINDIQNGKEMTKDTNQRLLRIDEGFVKTLRFTIFRLQNKSLKELLVVRAYPKSKFLKKKDGLIFDDGGILTFTKTDIMSVDSLVDCLVYEEEVIIFRRKAFERVFDFRKIFEGHFKEVFDEITEEKLKYKIEPLANLKVAILKDLRKLRKDRKSVV